MNEYKLGLKSTCLYSMSYKIILSTYTTLAWVVKNRRVVWPGGKKMLCFSANTSKVKVKAANHIGMEIHASEEHQENLAQFKQCADIFSKSYFFFFSGCFFHEKFLRLLFYWSLNVFQKENLVKQKKRKRAFRNDFAPFCLRFLHQ